MLHKKLMNVERSVDFWMNGSRSVQGGLHHLNIGRDAFRSEVEMMEVSGLGFFEKRLHVQQANHLLMAPVHRIPKHARCACRKKAKTDSDETH